MDHIKIIFFDIDGTLIDMNTKKISSKTIDALQQLKSKGILLCIATGRSPMGVPKFDNVEFDAYLTFNGSYCFNKEKTLYSNAISKEDVQMILENASKMNRAVSVATSKRLAANGDDQDLAEYYGFSKTKYEIASDFDQVIKGDIYQVMMACRKEEYERVLANTKHVKIAAWWDKAVDIIPANSGKGAGIQKILDYYHIKKEEVMAFGDGNNDIEMIEAVGNGIAMENASDELKRVAHDICGHVACDGIYHYCLEKGLITK